MYKWKYHKNMIMLDIKCRKTLRLQGFANFLQIHFSQRKYKKQKLFKETNFNTLPVCFVFMVREGHL